jgi:hypothetical protein
VLRTVYDALGVSVKAFFSQAREAGGRKGADWDKALAGSHSAEELKMRMKKLYPNLALERLLDSAAKAAFAPGKRQSSFPSG